jgi:uncharacterized membrane protein YcaP (DUF421 family)
MELDWIWKAALIVLVGTVLLRVAGRKSISQMTLAQTVLMIAIGSLLIQPIATENVWVTFGVGAMLVLTLVLLEFGQLKFDFIEKLITGKSVILIEDGMIRKSNLAKLRLTVDQLEMQLRQKNVTKMSDVKWATLEPNGQLGYTLKDSAQPATKQDHQKLIQEIETLKVLINTRLPHTMLILHNQNANPYDQTKQPAPFVNPNPTSSAPNENDFFEEVNNKSHTNPPPKDLQ